MELNLSPQAADTTVAKGNGGAYYVWSASKSPVLGQAKLGAGKLVLQPRGFALPHYADSYKIGFVIQGKPYSKTLALKYGRLLNYYFTVCLLGTH